MDSRPRNNLFRDTAPTGVTVVTFTLWADNGIGEEIELATEVAMVDIALLSRDTLPKSLEIVYFRPKFHY